MKYKESRPQKLFGSKFQSHITLKSGKNSFLYDSNLSKNSYIYYVLSNKNHRDEIFKEKNSKN